MCMTYRLCESFIKLTQSYKHTIVLFYASAFSRECYPCCTSTENIKGLICKILIELQFRLSLSQVNTEIIKNKQFVKDSIFQWFRKELFIIKIILFVIKFYRTVEPWLKKHRQDTMLSNLNSYESSLWLCSNALLVNVRND